MNHTSYSVHTECLPCSQMHTAAKQMNKDTLRSKVKRFLGRFSFDNFGGFSLEAHGHQLVAFAEPLSPLGNSNRYACHTVVSQRGSYIQPAQ